MVVRVAVSLARAGLIPSLLIVCGVTVTLGLRLPLALLQGAL